jgi:stage III sporulation protein AB
VLKIIFGLAIVVISTLLGYVLSKKYRQRRRFLGQFREFNEQFINEITYYRRPIKAFLDRQRFDGEFQVLLQSYDALLDQYTEKEGKVLDLSPYTFLSENEKADVYDYFMTLGKGDSESQKRYFLSMQERLTNYEAKAISQGKKYENLYIELGFLCGLFILVLII